MSRNRLRSIVKGAGQSIVTSRSDLNKVSAKDYGYETGVNLGNGYLTTGNMPLDRRVYVNKKGQQVILDYSQPETQHYTKWDLSNDKNLKNFPLAYTPDNLVRRRDSLNNPIRYQRAWEKKQNDEARRLQWEKDNPKREWSGEIPLMDSKFEEWALKKFNIKNDE